MSPFFGFGVAFLAAAAFFAASASFAFFAVLQEDTKRVNANSATLKIECFNVLKFWLEA